MSFIDFNNKMKVCFLVFIIIGISIFSKNVHAKPSFVYVKDGHFYKDGERINFYGVVAPPNSTWSSPTHPATSWTFDSGLDLMQRSGVNLVKFWVIEKMIMPTYGVLDNAYLTVLDNFVEEATKRRIYILWQVEFSSNNEWVTSGTGYGTRFNETSTKAYEWILGNLSLRYKDEPYVLGYLIPYEHLKFLPNNMMYMSGSDWATGNITVMWNFWLKNKYGTIENLNATWNKNTQSQLNASAGEDHFLTEWGDNQSGGIHSPLLLENATNFVNWKTQFRHADWYDFIAEWWGNWTKRIVDVIKNNDPNHLIGMRVGSMASGQVASGTDDRRFWFNYLKNVPDGIDFISFSAYWERSTTNDQRWLRLSSFPQNSGDAHFEGAMTFAHKYPLIVGESGFSAGEGGYVDNPYPWSDNVISFLVQQGIDGVTFYTWDEEGNGESGHGTITYSEDFSSAFLRPRAAILPYWADAFKNNKIEHKPQILVIGDSGYRPASDSLKYFFHQLGVQSARSSITVGSVEPEIFNDYKLIILALGKDGITERDFAPSKETLVKVREWAEAGNGSVLLIPHHWLLSDTYQWPYNYTELGYDTWIFKEEDGTGVSLSGLSSVNITFFSNFGDIVKDQIVSVTDLPTDFFNGIKSKFPSNIEIIANYSFGSTNKILIARNTTGNALFFGWDGFTNDLNYPLDSGWLTIWRSLLKEVGVTSNQIPSLVHRGKYSSYSEINVVNPPTKNVSYQGAYIYKTFTGAETTYVRMFFKLNEVPPLMTPLVPQMTPGVRVISAYGTEHEAFRLYIIRSGYDNITKLRLWYWNQTTSTWNGFASFNGKIKADTWYSLLFKHTSHPTNGGVAVYVNGIPIISVTGRNTTLHGNLSRIEVGARVADWYNPRLWIDDVVVDDEWIDPFVDPSNVIFKSGFETGDYSEWTGTGKDPGNIIEIFTQNISSSHLLVNDDNDGNYLSFRDFSAKSGTTQSNVSIVKKVTNNIDVDFWLNSSKSYALFEINPHNNITILPSPVYLGTYTGPQLQSGINLTFNAYHSKLLRVIDNSTPSYILVLNGSLVSENLTGNQLKIRVDSVPGTNVTTSIYIPEGFYPNDDFNVTTNVSDWNYSWNSSSRVLTVWCILESSAEITINSMAVPETTTTTIPPTTTTTVAPTEGPGGPGPGTTTLLIEEPVLTYSMPASVDMYKNETKEFTIKVTNPGTVTLHGITIDIQGIPELSYSISPSLIDLLEANQSTYFTILIDTQDIAIGSYTLTFNITSEETFEETTMTLKVEEKPAVTTTIPITTTIPPEEEEEIESKVSVIKILLVVAVIVFIAITIINYYIRKKRASLSGTNLNVEGVSE